MRIVLGGLVGVLAGVSLAAQGRGLWRYATLPAVVLSVGALGWLVGTGNPAHVAALAGVCGFVAAGVAFVFADHPLERIETSRRLAAARAATVSDATPEDSPE